MHPAKPGVFYQNGGTFPNKDNPNYIIQVGSVFGFIVSIESIFAKQGQYLRHRPCVLLRSPVL